MNDGSDEGEGQGGDGNVVHLDFKKKQEVRLPGAAGPEKLAAFEELVLRGKTMVTLDARRPGVRVPQKLQGELQLNLDFSTRFAGVKDFSFDDDGVRSTLTFGGEAFFVEVPWSAVWAMRSHVDNQMMLWPEDLPDEMLAQLPEAQLILKSKQEDLARKDLRDQGARVPREVPRDEGAPDDDAAGAPDDEGPPDGDGPGPKRPGLRLVK